MTMKPGRHGPPYEVRTRIHIHLGGFEEQRIELSEPIAGDDEPDPTAAAGHPQMEMIVC